MKNHLLKILASLLIVAAVLTADQLGKWRILDYFLFSDERRVELASFFNLVLVWNRGISFGMLAGANAALALVIMASFITLMMLIWLLRSKDWLTAIAIAFVLGGALGNIIDRFRFGAVVDFLDFHLGAYHWPAFNIADASIFIGVVLLCAESMLGRRKRN